MSGRVVSVLAVALFVAAAGGLSVAGQSKDQWLGTWKLNVAKSKYSGPAPTLRSQIVRMEAVPNGVTTFNDTVNAQGNTVSTVTTALFDGKEYEVKGVAMPTTRTYKRVGRDYEFVTRVNGKVVNTSRGAVSADGKTRTLTITGTNPAGQAVTDVIVYEKQ